MTFLNNSRNLIFGTYSVHVVPAKLNALAGGINTFGVYLSQWLRRLIFEPIGATQVSRSLVRRKARAAWRDAGNSKCVQNQGEEHNITAPGVSA